MLEKRGGFGPYKSCKRVANVNWGVEGSKLHVFEENIGQISRVTLLNVLKSDEMLSLKFQNSKYINTDVVFV